MQLKEILEHLNDTSERELEYSDNPNHGLSPFYRYLEQTGQKDENGIFLLTQKMLRKETTMPDSSMASFFWDRMNSSSSRFLIKKATRYYREPFIKTDFISMRYVYSGHCHIFTPQKEIVLNQGDMIVLNPGFVFSQQLQENDHVFTMMFDQTYIRDYLLKGLTGNSDLSQILLKYISNDEISQKYIIFHTSENHWVNNTIEEILCEQLEKTVYGDELMVSLLKTMLIQMIYCPYEYTEANTRNFQKIAGILNYVNIHYNEVTLSDLSEQFGYNQKYISKLFLRSTGISFKDYVFGLKCDDVCFQLNNSTLSVEEILYNVGITNESYFYRKFRSIYGLSPSEYRQKNKKQPVKDCNQNS